MEEQKIKFREILKIYIPKHFQFKEIWKNFPKSETPIVTVKKKKFRFLWLLEFIPFICLVGFFIGIFWDFTTDDFLYFLDYKLPLHNLLKTLSVSGLIGYGTNWLAIKMLFKPQKRRPIWGQGLIPAQKNRISEKLAFAIHRHVFNENYIKKLIHESEILPKISQIIVNGIESLLKDEEFLNATKLKFEQSLSNYFQKEENKKRFIQQMDKKLKEIFKKGISGWVFKAYTQLQPNQYQAALNNTIHEIPDTVMNLVSSHPEELEELIQVIKTEIPNAEEWVFETVSEILENLNLYEMFRKQIHQFDEGKLEEMIWGATNEQLRYIRDLGGVLGIVGGFLIWQPIFVSVFLFITIGVLSLIDHFLFKNSLLNDTHQNI